MDDDLIRHYLDERHGVRVPAGTARSVLISKLQAVAIAARDI